MRLFLSILLSITFLCLIHDTHADDDDQPEEKDPWDKSTDHYNNDQNENRNLNVDVTEESESEVHTEKKAKIVLKKEKGESQVKEEVDNETKEQFEDAVDETVRPSELFELKDLTRTACTDFPI